MKAILVIDKPESCTGCLLGIYNKEWFCLKTNKNIDITDRYHIPEWCPLKPIPQRIEQGYPTDDYTIGKADGWNACLKEITGDTE